MNRENNRTERDDYTNRHYEGNPEWRKPEDELKKKLNAVAQKYMAKAQEKKTDNQNVRLWLNQISPDNYDRKKVELRNLLFGDRKLKGEEGFEEQEELQVDEEKQQIVVQTIFRKAQSEHEYAGFYADLCSDIVR